MQPLRMFVRGRSGLENQVSSAMGQGRHQAGFGRLTVGASARWLVILRELTSATAK